MQQDTISAFNFYRQALNDMPEMTLPAMGAAVILFHRKGE